MRHYDLAICGHGMIPGLLVLELLARNPGQSILLLSRDEAIGGTALEPVLTTSLSPGARQLIESFIVARWPGFLVTRDAQSHRQTGEVLLLDPVQIWLELQNRLDPQDMIVCNGPVAAEIGTVRWNGGAAMADNLVDLTAVTRREQAEEIIGIAMGRSLPFPVLVDFDVGAEPWDAFQHIPLGDERIYIRKRKCQGDPVVDLTTGFGTLLSDLIAY